MRGADAIPGCAGGELGDVPHGRESRCGAPSCSHRRAHAIAPSHQRAIAIAPAPLRPPSRPGGSNIQIHAVRIWSARWPKRKRCHRFGISRERARGRSRNKNRRVHDMQRRRPCLGGGIFVWTDRVKDNLGKSVGRPSPRKVQRRKPTRAWYAEASVVSGGEVWL